MDMQSLLSAFFGEYEGKALQRHGEVTKDQITQFFTHGKQLFADPQFKLGLAMGHQQRKDVQSLVDSAQAQIWEQKVSPAVQGDFGIASLGKIRQRFQDDAEVLRMFYEFVHLEEKTLDEAEMPGDLFKKKYENMYAMKKAMEAKMAEYKEELDKLPPEDRDKYMAHIFKTLVEQSSGGPSCGSGGCSSCPTPMAMPSLPARPTTLAPAPIDGPNAHSSEGPGNSMGAADGAPGEFEGQMDQRVMLSEEEQLAFFKNLQRS